MWGVGEGNSLKAFDRVYFPHSAGLFYTAATQFLGFLKFGDEYKLLSLAKDVGDRKSIENKGGYFMKIVFKNMPEVVKAFKKKEIAEFLPQIKKSKSAQKLKKKKTSLQKKKS